jgi:RNA polymerase sigma-70 factor (ECF subfamily)
MRDDAFMRLVDQHYTGLYRFALSLARNVADAGDLTQQTFYVWATHGHALRDPTKAKSWLFTTLYREFLRSRKRAARSQSLEELPGSQEGVPDEQTDQVRRMDGQTVIEALGQVEETFRAPLTLFYLEEFSYREIAEMLEVPIGTVMSRLSRGKVQLRAAIESGSRSGSVVPFPQAERKQS